MRPLLRMALKRRAETTESEDERNAIQFALADDDAFESVVERARAKAGKQSLELGGIFAFLQRLIPFILELFKLFGGGK